MSSGPDRRMTSGPLSDAQRTELRQLIIEERARLAAQATTMAVTFDELVAAADLEPPDDEHDPDGTTAYERAQVSSLRSSSEQGAAALDVALDHLVDGTYGACTSCGSPIPMDRLLAVLGTDRCIACASGRS